jgi:hypothetical protein
VKKYSSPNRTVATLGRERKTVACRLAARQQADDKKSAYKVRPPDLNQQIRYDGAFLMSY